VRSISAIGNVTRKRTTAIESSVLQTVTVYFFGTSDGV
jgi:hypothetical protein